MVKLALQTSAWIRVSDWETQQKGWTRTRTVLQHHQNFINSYVNDSKKKNNNYIPSWLPEAIKDVKSVKLRLLCGADILQSFAVPGLWKNEDVSYFSTKLNSYFFTVTESGLVGLVISHGDLLISLRHFSRVLFYVQTI